MGEVRIVRAGQERIDDLEPLWKALQEHHLAGEEEIPGIPMRRPDDSWPRRRARYVRWLAEPDAFALIAEENDRPVGYALVTVHGPADDTHVTRDRLAELQSLSVEAGRRGKGVGGRLMEAVYAELRALDVRELVIGVMASNHEAIRYYERLGFNPWLAVYMGTIPDPPAEPGP